MGHEGELARVAGEDDDGMRATSDQAAGEEVDVDDEIQEGDPKTQKPRIARAPKEPTSLERAIHEVTHIPIRTWCRHCMRGRGKDVYHTRIGGEQDVPRVGMDYMYMAERGLVSKPEEPNVEYVPCSS